MEDEGDGIYEVLWWGVMFLDIEEIIVKVEVKKIFGNGFLVKYVWEKNFIFKLVVKYKWNFIWDVGNLNLIDYIFFFK